MSHNLKRRPDPLSLFVHNDCVVLSELFTVCDSSCSIKSWLRGYISCHFLNELFLLWLSFLLQLYQILATPRRHCSRGRSNMTAGCVAQVRVKRKIGTGCFGLIYVGVYRDCQVAVKHLHRSVKHTRATLESSAPSPPASSTSSTPTSSGCLLGSCRIEAAARWVVGPSWAAMVATTALRCGLSAAATASAVG